MEKEFLRRGDDERRGFPVREDLKMGRKGSPGTG
jgi:hypothetical protein